MAVRVTVSSTACPGTVPAVSTRAVSTIPTRAVVVPGTGAVVIAGSVVVAMRRPGRRVRGLLCGGHRPIIARTPDAHCSPRYL